MNGTGISSQNHKLTAFANALKAHKWETLAWYDYHISTRKLNM